MSPIGKIFVVLNLVFSLVLLGIVGAILSKGEEFKVQYEGEVTAHGTTKADLANAKNELQTRVNEYNARITQLEEKNDSLDAANRNVTTENESLKVDNQALADSVNKLQAAFDGFQSTLEQIRRDNTALVTANQQLIEARNAADDAKSAAEANALRLEQQVGSLNGQVKSLGQQIEDLSGEASDLNAQLEAAVQMGFDIAQVRPTPQIDGVVQNVNRDLELVVLSVGGDDGVTRGTRFEIFDDGEYKGAIVVDDVFPDNSSGRIVREAPGQQIEVQDNATTRL